MSFIASASSIIPRFVSPVAKKQRKSSRFFSLMIQFVPKSRNTFPRRRSRSCSRSITSSLSLGTSRRSFSSITSNNEPSPSNVSTANAASSMQDEYGDMTSDGNTYHYDGEYVLESGETLLNPQIRYQTYGTLNEQRDNVLVICHALTGNASLHAWWGDLLGPSRAFDTSQYFVVCCNILGSCYGSTSPPSIHPKNGRHYGREFPSVSVKDTVALQLRLMQDELSIRSIKTVIGGSFGGMQAVEFAAQAGSNHSSFTSPNGSPYCRSVVPIACGACHTAWQIAISEVQRQAIYADPYWNSDEPEKATAGLAVARQMGMVSYRTPMGYQNKFGRTTKSSPNKKEQFQVKSYLEYQGQKFLNRFDPVTYVKLTEQMDTHDVGRHRGGIDKALADVVIPALVLGIDSDVLYPLHEQEELANKMPNATLQIIESLDGHDGFLLEQDQVNQHITDFLREIE